MSYSNVTITPRTFQDILINGYHPEKDPWFISTDDNVPMACLRMTIGRAYLGWNLDRTDLHTLIGNLRDAFDALIDTCCSVGDCPEYPRFGLVTLTHDDHGTITGWLDAYGNPNFNAPNTWPAEFRTTGRNITPPADFAPTRCLAHLPKHNETHETD